MRFEVAGSRIICSRRDNTVADGETYRRVVAFDAHAKSIPRHVTKKLIMSEIEQLREFTDDRKRIQADPGVKNMLEALPGLLKEATGVLQSVKRVNETMYDDLSDEITRMRRALDEARPASSGIK